jgi:uncharacterized membrane protein YkoI
MIPVVLLATGMVSPACGGNSGPGDQRYDPPNTEFAASLGIEPPPPVTPDQAMAIAAEATGGTALSVDQETEGGQLLYEVQVRTSSGDKEVEVRASDGGVVEIESADND